MAEQMQRTASCPAVFVKAGALRECTTGVFSEPWPVDLLCSLPTERSCGAPCCWLLALAVTPGRARTRIFGGPTCLPALPSLQDGDSSGQPVPRAATQGARAAHAAQPPGRVMSCAVRCCGM